MSVDPQDDGPLRVSGSVYARPFGAEMVLLDFGRGEYYGLDEIGAEIWRGLERGERLTAIVDALVQRYDVSRDEAERDALDLVRSLRNNGLVTNS